MEKKFYIPIASVFKAYLFILKGSIDYLQEKYKSDNIDDIKSYQVVILSRIYKSMTTLEIILSQCNDPASSYGLLRTIIDSICAYCFIYDNSNEEEKSFRHYLYLLDGISKYLELFPTKYENNTLLSDIDKSQVLRDAKQSIDNMFGIKEGILNSLSHHCYMSRYPISAKSIVDKREWKFKSIDCDDKLEYYSWRGIYDKIGCNQLMSDFILKYLSQYVHGLFLSNTRDSNTITHYNLIYDILVTFIKKLINTVFRIYKDDDVSTEFVTKVNIDNYVNKERISLREALDYLKVK